MNCRPYDIDEDAIYMAQVPSEKTGQMELIPGMAVTVPKPKKARKKAKEIAANRPV